MSELITNYRNDLLFFEFDKLYWYLLQTQRCMCTAANIFLCDIVL